MNASIPSYQDVHVNKLDKKKVKRLIGMMNEMTAVEIPAMGPIIRCFEIGMDEDVLNYLLRVGTAPHSKKTLADLYTTMRATGEVSGRWSWSDLWDELMVMSFLIPCEPGSGKASECGGSAGLTDNNAPGENGGRNDSSSDGSDPLYELASIFPGWIELCTSGERTAKRVAIMESFMGFWKLLKTLNVAPVRALSDKQGFATRDAGESRMGALTSITPARTKKRSISLDEPLTSTQQVLTEGTAFEVLSRNKDSIAVMNCICRNHKEVAGDGCCHSDIPLKSCMPIGAIADQLVASGVADPVPYEQAVEMMKDFERKGCIHTTFHYAGDAGREALCICNCCVDCCLLYGGYQEGYLSKVQVRAYNEPKVVNAEACTGCNQCGKHCPTGAIGYNKATDKLDFDFDQCVGCGQCVTQCAFGVQCMVPNERNVYAKTRKRR